MATTSALRGALLPVRIMHRRLEPTRRAFHYRGFQLCIKMSELAQLPRVLRYTPLSFRWGDHGRRDQSSPEDWIQTIFAKAGIHPAEILLICYPRLWGYAFKPVSFWLGMDRDGQLLAVLAEVNNTFGEHHSYLVRHPDGHPIGPHDWLEAEKSFFVSPFFPVDGGYRFRFRAEERRVQIDIHYLAQDGKVRLVTQLSGQRFDLNFRSIWGVILANPFMSWMVIVGIHWEALKLWRSGIRLQRKPSPPNEEISL